MLTPKNLGEKIKQLNTNQKKIDIAILILDRIDFKADILPEIKRMFSSW